MSRVYLAAKSANKDRKSNLLLFAVFILAIIDGIVASQAQIWNILIFSPSIFAFVLIDKFFYVQGYELLIGVLLVNIVISLFWLVFPWLLLYIARKKPPILSLLLIMILNTFISIALLNRAVFILFHSSDPRLIFPYLIATVLYSLSLFSMPVAVYHQNTRILVNGKS